MPRMDGLQATRAIRAQPALAAMPILAMTANAFDEDRRACTEAGMNDFVAKPVDPDLLYAALLKWLLKNAPAPAAEGEGGASRAAVLTANPQLAALRSLPGINLAHGLTALRGNADKYLELLQRFVATHADDMTLLADHLATGDQASAARLVHTLKGTASTLGAEHLAGAARQLEQALLAESAGAAGGDPLRCAVAAVGEQFAALAAALPAARPAQHASQSAQRSTDELRPLLDQLDTLLKQSDTAAIALYQQNTALLGAILGETRARFEGQIFGFDFAPAQQTLQGLRRDRE